MDKLGTLGRAFQKASIDTPSDSAYLFLQEEEGKEEDQAEKGEASASTEATTSTNRLKNQTKGKEAFNGGKKKY